MQFIHAREHLSNGDVVVVQSSHQCNVRVMEDANFERFQNGSSHEYLGGFYKRFPARIRVPSTGYWNVTLDLAGGTANVKYSIRYLKN